MRPGLRLLCSLAPFSIVFTPLGACTSQAGDSPADAGPPTALGSGNRIRDVMNPTSPAHGVNGQSVTITGATYLLVDTYDETHNGKSIGTVYLQDVPPSGSPPPAYSGVSLYEPTYIPTNLVPAPGDVLDLVGTFDVSASLGSAVFTPQFLIQIDTPILQPRFEYQLPPPLLLTPAQLDEGDPIVMSAFLSAMQWNNMLVTLENVTFTDNLLIDDEERATIDMTSDAADGPMVDNELFDLVTWNNSFKTPPLHAGATIKSVTGIVTWFYNFHVAPRSAADIVVAGQDDGGQ